MGIAYIVLLGSLIGTCAWANPYYSITLRLLENPQNGSCGNILGAYAAALLSWEPWAVAMFDATSKLHPGLTKGNLADLGDYDLCLSINENTATAGEVRGKYCMGAMNMQLPVSMRQNKVDLTKLRRNKSAVEEQDILTWMWSFCIPDACNGTEAAMELNRIFDGMNLPLYLSSIIPGEEIQCQTEESVDKALTSGAIAAIIIFSIIFGLMVFETVYDIYLFYWEKETHHDLLIAFSVLTNGSKLFRIIKRCDQLPCLDGLRFISIMWVVFGHRFSITLATYAMNNAKDVFQWADSTYSMYVGSGTLSVDTFFLIGGLLVSYGFMKAVSKGISFNIIMYYVHRYIRLTPALGALTLFLATLAPYISSGPDYPSFLKYHVEPCREYWWSTILYIQNYVNVDHMCVGHSWYLNVDTQLFFLSPLVLIPLKKRPGRTIIAISILALACMACTFYIALQYHLSAIFTSPIKDDVVFHHYYYLRTHTRATPWLIGLILGYYIHQIKSNTIQLKINKATSWILWAITLAILLTCIFAGHGTLRGPEYDKWGNVIHITFIRPAWALALCWVILACISGRGGPINGFLSLPIFQVLNRLTYSIYLLHVSFMFGMSYARRTNVTFSDFNMAYLFWADFMFSTFLAVAWTLAFESPIIVVEKVLFGGIGKKSLELKEPRKVSA